MQLTLLLSQSFEPVPLHKISASLDDCHLTAARLRCSHYQYIFYSSRSSIWCITITNGHIFGQLDDTYAPKNETLDKCLKDTPFTLYDELFLKRRLFTTQLLIISRLHILTSRSSCNSASMHVGFLSLWWCFIQAPYSSSCYVLNFVARWRYVLTCCSAPSDFRLSCGLQPAAGTAL